MIPSLDQALYSDLLLDLQPFVRPSVYPMLERGEIDYFPGCTVREVACMHLMNSILKKYQDRIKEDADGRAHSKFLAANERCGTWSLQVSSEWQSVLVGEFRRAIHDFYYKRGTEPCVPSNLVAICEESDLVGPGAAVGARGEDFYTKLFSSPLTCTNPVLYDVYSRYLSTLPLFWQEADSQRRARWAAYEVVAGSRLSYVPKTYEVSRTICSEPTLNMLVQKGIGNSLERRLRQYFGIDLKSQQTKNREHARRGSEDDTLATLDLASASDTISLRMCREFLPTSLMGLLELTRSPVADVVSTGDRVTLQMVSTMGNGYTFPLQTAIFACVVQACYTARGIVLKGPHGPLLGNFGVNGDDIIVRREAANDVVSLLTLLGFEVNKTKSFIEGPFRESCGGDYYRGRNVRGVYIETLSDPQSRYAAINALVRWAATHEVSVRRACQRLLSTVRYLPVPPWESMSAGIQVPSSMIRQLKRCKKTKSVLYERYVFEPVRLKVTDCEILVPNKVRQRLYNPPGLLAAALHGSLRGPSPKAKDRPMTITIRHDRGWFRRRYGVAPNWDCTDVILEPVPDRTRWEIAAWLNLTA